MKKLAVKIVKRLLLDRRLSSKGSWGSFWNYRKGFLQDTIDICGITKENYKEFISDRDYRKGHPYNGPYSPIIDNKLWLPLLLKDYSEILPNHYYFKDFKGFHRLRIFDKSFNDDIHSINLVIELIKTKNKLVFKHTHSSIGQGFLLVEYRNNEYFINNKTITRDNLEIKLSSLNEYIVTDYIEQQDFSRAIACNSLNTVRLQYLNGKLVRSFHRFGCNGNVVDNVGSGNGILVYVDPATGKFIDKGVLMQEGKFKQIKKDICHPDNDFAFLNLEIPNYKKVVERTQEIIDSLPFLSWIGLDIAITNDSFYIIEFNSLTTLATIQQEKGFKGDKITKEIF